MPAAASLSRMAALIGLFSKPFLLTFCITTAALRLFRNVRVVGVTGSIASGKSAFCRVLRSHGAGLRVIDADEVARDIVAPGFCRSHSACSHTCKSAARNLFAFRDTRVPRNRGAQVGEARSSRQQLVDERRSNRPKSPRRACVRASSITPNAEQVSAPARRSPLPLLTCAAQQNHTYKNWRQNNLGYCEERVCRQGGGCGARCPIAI
jgi:hypothetical protein